MGDVVPYWLSKRALDLVVAFALLVVLSPAFVFAFAALALSTSCSCPATAGAGSTASSAYPGVVCSAC
jgi:hypothetical protein